jgi:glycosyltransferase involved in cell wall biosynthesis
MIPLKIIQVVHAFPPDIGGIEAHVYNLSKELAKKGHEVTVVTTRTKGAKNDETVDGVRILRQTSLRLPMFSSVRIVPFQPLRLALMDADVYHSHGYGSAQPFFTSLAAFIKRKPFVFTLHGYPKLKGAAGIFKKLYTNLPARVFLRIARKVITVTSATVPDIEKEAVKEKIVTIPNGVDFRQFKCKAKLSALKTNVVLYVGRLDAYKGIDTLVQAFAEVKSRVPDAKLRIIGRDEGVRGSLEKLASKLRVEVEFKEVLPGEMPNFYESASAVVLPSKYEGLSIVLLEAISFERPTFSTPVGAAPKLFQEVYGKDAQKFIFGIGESHELSDSIIEALRNKKEFEKICSLARGELVKKYSWSSVADRTIEVYKEVVEEQG